MNIYLAHPITGLSSEEVFGYYDMLKAELAPYYSILSPMAGKDHFRKGEAKFASSGYVHPVSNNHSIVKRDYWMVSQADIILVDLRNVKRAIGCLFELAWAHQLRKHCIVVMEPDNPYQHAFVLECADIVFETLDSALEYLKQLKNDQ